MQRTFQHLSDGLQGSATIAASLDLAVAAFNSGVARHSSNGIRVFRSKAGAYVDYFRGDHLCHLQTMRELDAFLGGYGVGRDDAITSSCS